MSVASWTLTIIHAYNAMMGSRCAEQNVPLSIAILLLAINIVVIGAVIVPALAWITGRLKLA
jgi:hypothetical protein